MKSQPGRVDVLHMTELYELADFMPRIEARIDPQTLPARFVAWPNRKRAQLEDGLHFFVDDYRFESVWANPERYIVHMPPGKIVLGPDFSVYPEWPLVAQMWNVYRARWVTAALRSRGVQCVPAVTWGDRSSYSFAFDGLSYGCTVAISAYGATRTGQGFREGYEMLLERVKPSNVLVVGGRVPSWMQNIYYYPSGTIADGR